MAETSKNKGMAEKAKSKVKEMKGKVIGGGKKSAEQPKRSGGDAKDKRT